MFGALIYFSPFFFNGRVEGKQQRALGITTSVFGPFQRVHNGPKVSHVRVPETVQKRKGVPSESTALVFIFFVVLTFVVLYGFGQ